MLNLKKARKVYVTASENVEALKGISLAFRKKEFVSVLGASGCGKTTLLNIIGGLDHYTDGDLVIQGRSTKSYTDRDWDVYRNHRIGFIFQSYNLIPHQTVLGNVELALTISGVSKEERVARAKEALDRVGLKGQYNKRPNQLSGGQCQRVAIARALVNDPEILLADEPTGALDTQTSKQIMELIREISGERLVIMVTHNPEIADEYSSRIIRLSDGLVVEDSNPFTSEEEENEVASFIREEKENEKLLFENKSPKEIKTINKRKKERAKMSFLTAFKLSARNLWSKKGRTSMVGIAGSIGIIGIALVLAFSAGIKGYISSMQDDMLSGNPISITETTYDINAITSMMNSTQKGEIIKYPDKAHIDSLIEYIAEMSEFSDSLIIKNDITREYIDYVLAMNPDYYNAMLLNYGIDMSHSIYTNLHTGLGNSKSNDIFSVAAITNRYTSVLKGTNFSQYASYITQIVPSFKQAPNNTEYIASQYDVYGEIADEHDEIMIVLNGDKEISDMLLARLGYYTEEQFYNLIYKVSKVEKTLEDGTVVTDEKGKPVMIQDPRYNPELDIEYIDYSTLLDSEKTFVWYPNDKIFTEGKTPFNPFEYSYNASELKESDGVKLKVTGILVTNETTNYGCLTSGIYYTEALTKHVLEKNSESKIVKHVEENGDITSMEYMGMKMGIYYSYEYQMLNPDENGETMATDIAYVGSSLGIEDIMGAMGGSGGGSGSTGGMGNVNMSEMKRVSARMLGGVDIANEILIYPNSFVEKDLVTEYLDAWNTDENKLDVTYTDTLEIIIGMLNTMIDVVSYALIAFTSVSLVVSTVMIGIITYVSVVERIKEIGVIRALGGRKKDVSHLFNAETFIIGFLAGLIGVVATYLISAIVNVILKPLIGYAHIAALPFTQALLLISLSVFLTLISGLIPARGAAKRDPVVALRTE
jgi:putative ABC transport system permease protein